MPAAAAPKRTSKRQALLDTNRLAPSDRPVHDWYRFVLSFPPHLVRDYLDQFGIRPGRIVLDPFCGTGTTLVECKKLGIESFGLEAHPLSHFAVSTKLDWTVDPASAREQARRIAAVAHAQLEREGLTDDPQLALSQKRTIRKLRSLPPEAASLILTDSISPLPLHKTLMLLQAIDQQSQGPVQSLFRLALAREVVNSISNLYFGPEVGVSRPKQDAAVIAPWLERIQIMADDLERVGPRSRTPASVFHGDARCLSPWLPPESIDAVITSPPYPNEKDYTRTTRLETVLLGFLNTKADLRKLKQGMLRSNTRNVYARDDDDHWVQEHPEIQRVSAAIEARRIALGKTSGFERLYARVTRLYFGGIARHLSELRPALKRGARLAYVVGDQASYLRVMIRTGTLLADLAQRLGYEVEGIDLFRTRHATATREQLREEVVRLRWTGRGEKR